MYHKCFNRFGISQHNMREIEKLHNNKIFSKFNFYDLMYQIDINLILNLQDLEFCYPIYTLNEIVEILDHKYSLKDIKLGNVVGLFKYNESDMIEYNKVWYQI